LRQKYRREGCPGIQRLVLVPGFFVLADVLFSLYAAGLFFCPFSHIIELKESMEYMLDFPLVVIGRICIAKMAEVDKMRYV